MQNKEFFENYGTEKWAVEQNLCFLLQEYWEAIRERTGVGRMLESSMPLNPVSFVKEFMKEETLVDTQYVEMSKMNTLQKKDIANGTFSQSGSAPSEFIDADFREIEEGGER